MLGCLPDEDTVRMMFVQNFIFIHVFFFIVSLHLWQQYNKARQREIFYEARDMNIESL